MTNVRDEPKANRGHSSYEVVREGAGEGTRDRDLRVYD